VDRESRKSRKSKKHRKKAIFGVETGVMGLSIFSSMSHSRRSQPPESEGYLHTAGGSRAGGLAHCTLCAVHN